MTKEWHIRILVGFMLDRARALRVLFIIVTNRNIRVSGAIVKPSDVRVEEIALRVWGTRGELQKK